MGQRDLRTLLVQGAMAVYQVRKCGWRLEPDRIGRKLLSKHPKVQAVAWANRAARIAWCTTR